MTAQGVKRQLLNAGIPPENIPDDWLTAIVAATFKWIKTSREGANYIFNLWQDHQKTTSFGTNVLEFEHHLGEDDTKYQLVDEHDRLIKNIPADDIYFFRGVFYNGEPVPYTRLHISKEKEEECDECGIISHCTTLMRDPSNDGVKNICNYCLTHHENPRINDYGDYEKCDKCPSLKCSYSPAFIKKHVINI